MTILDKALPGAIVLMEAKTASGNGEWKRWDGGEGSLHVFGTFGGTDAVKLQMSLDGGVTATDIASASWTAATATVTPSAMKGICLVRAVATISDTTSFNVIISPPGK